MKKKFLILIIGFVCIFIQAETIDRIVAKVGDKVILESELETQYQQYMAMGMIDESVSKEEVLDQMIESELILIEAEASDISVDEFEVKKTVEDHLNQLRKSFGSELEFRKILKEETGMDISELKAHYTKMITKQKLKESLIMENITSNIHVTDRELEEYYQENSSDIPVKEASDKIGMILLTIKPGKETRSKVEQEIFEIKNKLNIGEDFAELAKDYSDCSSSKNGGNLGWVERGEMVKPFEDVAFKLEVGEISNPVETQFGYHLILLQDKKDEKVKLSHILINLIPSKEDSVQIEKLANNIHAQLLEGEDFGTLAMRYSEDDSSSVNQGIIGEFPSDQYPELFRDYLEELDYGEYTDVIQEGENLYIFKKIEAVPERLFKFEEVREWLDDRVKYQKEQKLYKDWIESLKKKNYIKISL